MKYIAGVRRGDGMKSYIKVYELHGFGETTYEYLFGSTCTKDMAYCFSTEGEAIIALNIYLPKSIDNLYPFIEEVDK